MPDTDKQLHTGDRSRYIDGLDLRQRLAHVQEEAGELVAAVGKTQRWGEYSVNPELPANLQEMNISWIIREWEDLKAAMSRYLEDFAQKEDAWDIVAPYLKEQNDALSGLNPEGVGELVAAVEEMGEEFFDMGESRMLMTLGAARAGSLIRTISALANVKGGV